MDIGAVARDHREFREVDAIPRGHRAVFGRLCGSFRIIHATSHNPKLPGEQQQLEDRDNDQGPGESGELAIDRRFFLAILSGLCDILLVIFGIERFKDKRRRFSAAYIWFGFVLILGGLLYWWLWPGWLL